MNVYDFYITPEEYVLAEKNGISKKTLENRIRVSNWDKQRAITTPVRKRNNIPKKIKELAKANCIGINTLYARICNFKWSFEKAATEPIRDTKTTLLNATEKRRKYPKQYVEKAKANGILEHNFRRRIREYGWSLEKAATTPIMTKNEIGKMVKETFKSF